VNSKSFIIVPYYNEIKRVDEEFWRRILENKNICLYFVDDGSNDGSEEAIKALFSNYSNAFFTKNYRNQGKSQSIVNGFNIVLSEHKDPNLIIGFLDFDSAFSIHDISAAVDFIRLQNSNSESVTLWTSRRKNRENQISRKLHRHIIGRIVHVIIKSKLKEIPYDTQCGFKLFNRVSATSFSNMNFRTKWLFEIEFLKFYQSTEKKLIIYEYELRAWNEVPGSKVTTFSGLLQVFRDLFLVLRKA
jgi:dolichyl-phosphate beta-glucosyltransferase